MANNEHIVHVIKKIRIFVNKLEFQEEFFATVYDGGTHLETVYGDTYQQAHDGAVQWVWENFNVPDEITIHNILKEGE